MTRSHDHPAWPPRLDRRTFLRASLVGAGGIIAGACQAPVAAPRGAPAAPVAAEPAGWQQRWDTLVAAARQEGSLVLHGPPTPETRQQLPTAFQQRFGIPVEYVSVRTSELASKMVAEKQAGLVTIDVALSGIASFADVLHPAGLLAEQKSHLILPEVTDPSFWIEQRLLFIDPEQNRLLRLINTAPPFLTVNRDQVAPASIRSAQDLLRPEFRGRIVADDPLVAGPGSVPPAYLLGLFGEEYLRKLYTEQVVAVRDPRQRGDGLARGQYWVGMGVPAAEIQTLIDEGFPIEVVNLPDAPGYTAAALGISAVIEGAPHPNAARVFANWIASREGVEVYSRTQSDVGARTDLSYADWVPSYSIPKPGVNYLLSYDWEFKTRTQPAAQAKLREMLGGR